jgi:peroxiredoxin
MGSDMIRHCVTNTHDVPNFREREKKNSAHACADRARARYFLCCGDRMAARTNERIEQKPALAPGAKAPDFLLRSTPDQQLSLHEFKGRPLIICFYPADWSPVCGDQLALYNELLPEFRRQGADLIAISVDGVWCHLAYSQTRKLRFPLLSDFEPKGAVARDYGVYRKSEGVCERALFVLDERGIVRWSYVSPSNVNPGADGILSALETLAARKARQPAPQRKEGTNGKTSRRASAGASS